jgi:hypothetical protein
LRPLWRLKSIALCIASLVVLALASAPIASAATAPVLTGSYSDPTSVAGATSTAISGHYAYTTAYGSGELTAIDISNPAAPVVTGSSQPSNNLLNATTVNISGGIAYVVSKNRNGPCQPGPAPSLCGTGSNDDGTGNSLTLLDVSTNPANPTIMGTIRDPVKLFGGYGVAVSGHYAYVAAQGCLSGQPCPDSSVGNALQVIDVSNPASPTIVRTIHNTSLLNHADGVTVAGNYAYVSASYGHNMTIVDISSPTAARIVGHITDSNNISFPVDTVIKGKYAYVGNQSGLLPHLAVVDISNPANPTLVTTLTDPTNLKGTYRLRLRGNFIYASAVNVATVSAIDISNPTSPRLAGSITDTTHLNRTTGLDVDPTGKYVVANSPYLASQSNQTYPPFTTNTGTISVVSLDPQPIGLTIAPGSEPPNSTTQTSAQFTFSTTDVVASTACQLDGGAAGPCTTAFSQSYSSLPPGAHTFTVTATDAAGSTASASYSWTIQQAPANTTSPSISGSAVAGQTLTAADGTWTGTPPPTYTRQWSSCDSAGANCQPISGATGASYTVQPADAGRTLEVTVTATNSVGSAAATSAPTATVTAAGPVNTTAPAISGTASQGQTLTVSNGTWTATPPASFSYQWLSCDATGSGCQPISGATANTYTAQASDVGLTLSATVTATNSGGTSSAGAAATARLSGPPVNTAAPTISGTAAEAQTLTAAPGTWGGYPAPSFAYQWSSCDSAGANCQPISGATASPYVPLARDVGATLAVRVTATNSAGQAQSTSSATAVIVTAAGPVTKLLDDFNRTNNTGPPSTNWTRMPLAPTGTTTNLLLSGQQAAATASNSADFWNAAQFGPAAEDWVTVAAKPAGDSEPVILGLRVQSASATTASGYFGYFINRSTGTDQYKITIRVNGVDAGTLASATGPELSPGDRLLFRANGPSLELWRGSGGTWTLLLTATDTRITGAGSLALWTRNTVVRLDDFGGGTLP